MPALLDAFWRAAAYCLHPRVIALSLAPLLIAAGLVGGLAWWQGAAAVEAVRATLAGWGWLQVVYGWFGATGAFVQDWVAPVLVILVSVPLLVVLSLLLVALLMTPAIVGLVARRRFPALERRQGAAWWQVWGWSLVSTLLALALLVVSLPLWLLPPLALVLPPLIWGWLSYRVFAFEVLAAHASAHERRRLMAEHRAPLLTIGVIVGFAGAAPALLWAAGALTLVLAAPLLLVLSVWLYTVVFAFAAAWFAHYALAQLQALRRAEQDAMPVADAPAADAPPPALAGDVVDVQARELPPPDAPRDRPATP